VFDGALDFVDDGLREPERHALEPRWLVIAFDGRRSLSNGLKFGLVEDDGRFWDLTHLPSVLKSGRCWHGCYRIISEFEKGQHLKNGGRAGRKDTCAFQGERSPKKVRCDEARELIYLVQLRSARGCAGVCEAPVGGVN